MNQQELDVNDKYKLSQQRMIVDVHHHLVFFPPTLPDCMERNQINTPPALSNLSQICSENLVKFKDCYHFSIQSKGFLNYEF